MGAAKAAIVEAIPVASEALAKNVELGTRDVAQRLGKSENWVRARWQAGDLPGRKVSPNRIIFTESAIQQYVTTTRRVTTTVQARAQPDLGPRAAAIYERLEKGESVSTIVRELE